LLLDYFILCFVAFISATLFPLGSEALFLYDLNNNYNPYLLLIFVSIGNILGSILNYYLGLKGEEFLQNKRVINANKLSKAKKFFDKYAGYSLLLAWVPIIGDPLTFIAGILKYDIKKFILLVSISKISRYLFIFVLYRYYS
jgi:membrane protein YqaA with SNARE-associated domain